MTRAVFPRLYIKKVFSIRGGNSMTIARSRLVQEGHEGTFHCISRCVRSAFLCGHDTATNKNYEHRRKWLYSRLVELSGIFLMDVCGYAVMGNHLHVILRIRPDLSGECSDLEIADRWWRLFPKRRTVSFQAAEPTEEELALIIAGDGRVEELRARLASLSWFMRCLKENIARRANVEDGCTGRFWEGRFKSIALLDQAALLTCLAYVDLNPIRAGMAESPESSAYTSAQERIEARQAEKKLKAVATMKPLDHQTRIELEKQSKRDQWLCPFMDQPHRRGFLDVNLEEYLELLDWTGRQIVEGKKGAIPPYLAPILFRLDVDQEQWLFGCRKFGTLFYRVAGKVTCMAQAAREFGHKWLKGQKSSKALFLAG